MISKITAPKAQGVVRRERLFRLLDHGSERPVLWISAPAGSGKSMLVASWLEARKLPGLWLKLDAGDSDPASFFFYLGLAAQKATPRKKKTIPLLTPEYLLDVPTFSRRFFEDLCARFSNPQWVLVLDNYQEVPADSVLHDLLQQGFDALPDGATAIVISRSEPVSQFSRLRANGRVAIIGWNELRFTLDEVKDAVKPWRKGHCLERECPGPDILYEKTDGWAAGLRLMIEAVEPQRGIVRSTPPDSPVCHCVESLAWKDNVFSYFACEVMNRTDRSISDFLISTSLLPFTTPAVAAKLTGRRDAAAILSDLSRRNFFTDWHPGPVPVYQYHFLFREFLQAQAQSRFDADELTRIHRTGAELLEEAGFIEEAAALFSKLGEYNRAVPLIIRIARPLLSQGRSKTVEGLLAALPETTVASDPGLLHIAGLCRVAVDPRKARGFLEASFRLLKEKQQYAAAIPVCGGIIETILYEADNFQDLDPYVEWLDGIPDRAEAPVRNGLQKISGTVLFALAYRSPGHRSLPVWLERAEAALADATGAMETLKLRNHLMAYYLFRGEFGSFGRLLRTTMRQNKDAATVPMIALHGLLHEAFHAVFAQADTEAGIALARKGLERAEETGVRVYDFWFAYGLISASLIAGDVQTAEAFLQGMLGKGTIAPRKRAADLRSLAGHVAFEKGDWTGAAEDFQAALDLALRIGDRYSTVWYRICLAQAWHCRGDSPKAREILAEVAAEKWAYSLMYHYQGLLTSALIDLREGAGERGLETLREALALGGKHALMLAPFWNRELSASLLARALEAGIETEFVRQVIKKHRLQPPPGEPVTDAWPWPVNIFTLGRFEILRDGRPLRLEGKIQKKPIEMLKAIIAFGGREVPEERIMDALWTDADGDAARRAFKTALHRLRQGLGDEKYILLKNGRLSLSEEHCRVDVIEFWRAAAAAGEGEAPIKERIAEKALSYYRGPFLPEDEGRGWSGPMRERARRSFIRLVGIVAGGLIEAGRFSEAARYYEDAVDVDELDEDICTGLMKCYALMRRKDKVAKSFRRYSDALRSRLDIGPSEEAQELYERLTRQKK